MSDKTIRRCPFPTDTLVIALFGLIVFNGVWTTEAFENNVVFQGKYKFKKNVEEAELQSEIKNVVVAQKYELSNACQSVQWSDENCVLGPVSIETDIEEHVFHQLCPQSLGKYEAPSSCDLYIVCHGVFLTVNQCPPSYHYNSRFGTCVDKQSYECSHPVRHASSLFNISKSAKSKLKREKRSFVSFDSDISHPASTVGDHSILTRSIKSNGDCPVDYVRPHPASCTKFLICTNGKFVEQDCGVGAKFNPMSRVCDLEDNVDCESRITDLGTYDCQPNYIYITSHFLYCNKFIECDHGDLHVKNCPPNLVFNAETSQCDYPQNYPCDKPVHLDHDIDVNYLRKSRDVSKYVCEFNYIAPIEGVCNEFLECEGTKLFRKSCGPGTAYNVLLGQCDWPHNVRAPDAQYCSRYLQCDGKHYVPRTCPPDTFFNAGTGQCDTIDIVDCNGKIDNPRLPKRPPSSFTPPPRTTPRTTTYPPFVNSK